jgi:hypothetical protein
MGEHKIARKDAAKLIEEVRTLAARGNNIEAVAMALKRAGIPLLAECSGEAHTNPHIDNCGVCAPRWGLVGDTVKVT